MKRAFAFVMPSALLLAACSQGSDSAQKEAAGDTSVIEAEDDTPVEPLVTGEGTPMEDRVATLGFLNKRNGITQDLEMKPGESQRIGPAIVRLRACERTAPWEPVPETGAFVQLFVETRTSKNEEPKWLKAFSGWLFKESPSVNVVEHPIYDVWVKDCAMRFPGEEGLPKPARSRPASDNAPSAAAPSSNADSASGSGSTGSSNPAPPAPAEETPAEPSDTAEPEG